MKNIIYLGSKSPSRRMLLEQAQIPYQLVSQDADETACDWGLTLQKVVESIALHKMEHVILPQGNEGQICFVLTADTLSQDSQGTIHGKPENREDGIAKIKAAARGANRCGTAFCLDKKIFNNNSWQLEQRIVQFVESHYEFIVPDEWIERYLDISQPLEAAGSIKIEGYGNQFLKIVRGSYSTIVGLPMFQLREALQEIGFFNS